MWSGTCLILWRSNYRARYMASAVSHSALRSHQLVDLTIFMEGMSSAATALVTWLEKRIRASISDAMELSRRRVDGAIYHREHTGLRRWARSESMAGNATAVPVSTCYAGPPLALRS